MTYTGYQTDLGLTADSQNLSCMSMWSSFAWGGSSNKLMYFNSTWN